MAQIVWTAEALASLATISEYVAYFHPPAARRIYQRLLKAGESLATFPLRGRPAGAGKRELPIVPPYVIRYAVKGDIIYIYNIRHGRQSDPG